MDNKSHVDICDLLMLAVCLEDQEDGSSPTELWRALLSGGHEHTLSDEFLQMVKGDVLHAECLSYGTEADVPQIESILIWRVSCWMEPGSSSIRRILSKLSIAI